MGTTNPNVKVSGRELSFSPGVKARNPHLFGQPFPHACKNCGMPGAVMHWPGGYLCPGGCKPVTLVDSPTCKPKRRIRQNQKPLLNKLETEALAWLQLTYPSNTIYKQALRFKLANGAWYKPDLAMFSPNTGWLSCWEVKGTKGKNIDRGKLALKIAAHQFPDVRWFMLWRYKGEPWQQQEILP